MWKHRLLNGSAGRPDQVTLGQYYDELARGVHPAGRRLSWNNPENGTLWAELQRDLGWPRALQAPSFRSAVGDPAGYFGLFMGPQGAGVSRHHHKAEWNALLFGRKLWVLTPPAQSSFRRDELASDSFGAAPQGQGWLDEAVQRAAAAQSQHSHSTVTAQAPGDPFLGKASGAGEADESSSFRAAAADGGESATRARLPDESSGRRLYCVQRAGDVMFVPQGWGHSTLNLRESIGVANFFTDEDAVGYRPSKLFHSSRGIRSLQTAAGITSPSDYDPDGHP